ncbi:hypothetical protein BDR05DRAFT_958926 [Suillus weaverae]|nr:hypothetical protein BDR05DRAFT_958926 [Suillus weaverae]
MALSPSANRARLPNGSLCSWPIVHSVVEGENAKRHDVFTCRGERGTRLLMLYRSCKYSISSYS